MRMRYTPRAFADREAIFEYVARMKRSGMRGGLDAGKNPDFASLHPGYALLRTPRGDLDLDAHARIR
jgi:hypothetical protein